MKVPSNSAPTVYNLKLADQVIARTKLALGEVREGAKMFECDAGKKVAIVPFNWETMVESYELWAIVEKSLSILGWKKVYDEASFAGQITDNTIFKNYCAGLLLSLEEAVVNLTNFSTTSDIEKGRHEGQARRVQSLCGSLGVSMTYTRPGKTWCTVTGGPNDTMVRAIQPNISDRNYNAKAALWITKIFTAAQAQKAKSVVVKDSDFALSFDELWAMTGDIKRGPNGVAKHNRSGQVQRYHPGVPKYTGMTKEEEIAAKTGYDLLKDALAELRVAYGNRDPRSGKEYMNIVQAMKCLYSAQVQANKGVKALCDARLESLRVNKGANKAAVLSKINQAKAAGEYKPVFDEGMLVSVIVKATKQLVTSSEELWYTGEDGRVLPDIREHIKSGDLLSKTDKSMKPDAESYADLASGDE